MTTTEVSRGFSARARPAAAPALSVPLAIAAALALGLVLTWPRVLAVWQTGAFVDTDDAMRMVQVRDLMAGQGWFDMVAHRLNPPGGVLMHWSRVIDVPLVALIALFRLVANPEAAERLARLAFPLALQGGLYAGLAWCGGLLIGARGRIPAIVLGFLSGLMFGQFQPGRIDHHAPQIMLLVFVVGASLAALDRSRAHLAAVAGLLTAVSVAISIENLPFFVALYGMVALAFVLYGDALRSTLLWLAVGLAPGLIAFFAGTVPPSRYFVGGCDAFSAAHMIGGLAAAAAFVVLGLGLPRWRSLSARAIAVTTAGLIAMAALALTYPGCFGDPLAQVDPFVKDVWLSKVWEAMPLPKMVEIRPETLPVIVLPIVLGFVAALCAAWREAGLQATRWACLAALIGVGLLTAFWQIRVFSSAAPLAAVAAAYAVLALTDRLVGPTGPRALTIAVLCLPFSSMAYAIVVPSGKMATNDGSTACLTPQALAPLAALPPGLVVAPIDSGSHLLSETPHSVIAAPYHRNSVGNRRVIEILLASPDAAEHSARASGADYVMLCPTMHAVETLKARAPDGLAAMLADGNHPAWLKPLPLGDTPYRVFTLRPPSPARNLQ
jgi:hypothetical protein